MIYQNKKFYFLSFKGGKYARLVKGNDYNDYDIIVDSFNINVINKYIKDNKIRGYKVVDDCGNVERVFYKTAGNIGGIPTTHYDVCGLSILKGLI